MALFKDQYGDINPGSSIALKPPPLTKIAQKAPVVAPVAPPPDAVPAQDQAADIRRILPQPGLATRSGMDHVPQQAPVIPTAGFSQQPQRSVANILRDPYAVDAPPAPAAPATAAAPAAPAPQPAPVAAAPEPAAEQPAPRPLADRVIQGAATAPSSGAGTLGGDPNRLAQIKNEYAASQERDRLNAAKDQQMAMWQDAQRSRMSAAPQAYEIEQMKRDLAMAQLAARSSGGTGSRARDIQLAQANAAALSNQLSSALAMRASAMNYEPPNVLGMQGQVEQGVREGADQRDRQALNQARVRGTDSEAALNQARVPLVGAEAGLVNARTGLTNAETAMTPYKQRAADQALAIGDISLQQRAEQVAARQAIDAAKTPEDRKRLIDEYSQLYNQQHGAQFSGHVVNAGTDELGRPLPQQFYKYSTHSGQGEWIQPPKPGGGGPTQAAIPPEAIDYLKKNPGQMDNFKKKYGLSDADAIKYLR